MDRKQLESSMRQVTDWLRGAEELLDSGYDGLDYSTMDQTLSEYTVSVKNISAHVVDISKFRGFVRMLDFKSRQK